VFTALEGFADYEVLYVDSASEDDTVKIAGKFPIRILQLRREWTLTPSAGRFIGYQHASGRYLAFVDGDSVLDPRWLAESCAFLRDNPDYGGVAGILEKVCLSDDGACAPVAPNFDRRSATSGVRTVGSLPGIATYQRQAMAKAGTFNPYLPTGEECEVALRIRRAGYKLARIARPMCTTHTLPPESVREIMRRSRAHLYDYGATLRYCLTNGSGLRFSIEQMWFVYTFVAAVAAILGALVIGWLTGSTWLLAGAAAAVACYLAVKRKHPRNLAVSTLKRAMATYRTILSFLSTRPVPMDSYPRDVVVVK
jgi:glycosyltransferase involved in cell wall biosynthesis